MSISDSKLNAKIEARKRSSQLVDRIWTIQDRLVELVEFEKQWDKVFALLHSKAGQDRRVNILNTGVYRSFRWDRYQVVLGDLLSLLENEMPATLELAQEVRDIRDEFNLKYSDATALQSSYLDEKLSLEKIDDITGKVFEIVSDNSAWMGRPESARSDFSHVSSISDQIDLILFGSIKAAIAKFYLHADKTDAYWLAREKYFASDTVLEISSNWNVSK